MGGECVHSEKKEREERPWCPLSSALPQGCEIIILKKTHMKGDWDSSIDHWVLVVVWARDGLGSVPEEPAGTSKPTTQGGEFPLGPRWQVTKGFQTTYVRPNLIC